MMMYQKLIKTISHRFTVNKILEESLDVATFGVMMYHQSDHDMVASHIKNIKNLCQAMEHTGGWFIDDKELIKVAKKKKGNEVGTP